MPWRQLAIVLLGTFLGPFGGMIVGVAMPSIANDFGIDIQSAKWITLVFWVVTTFLVPVTGYIGRRFGEERMFTAGFIVDAAGTLLCALTPQDQYWLLLIFRVIQAIGSATMFALFGALVTKITPPDRRGFAFGLAGATVALSITVAPVLGGLLLDSVGWRGVFLVQLPLHIAGIVGSLLVLRRSPVGAHDPLPLLSAGTWLLMIGGSVAILEAYSKGAMLDKVGLLWLLTAAAAVGFYFAESRGRPLFAYALFRIPVVAMTLGAMLLSNVVLFAMILLLPFYLEDYLGFSSTKMGLLLGLSPLTTLIVAPLAGGMSDRRGYRLPILCGLMAGVAGMLLIAAGIGGSIALIGAGMVLMGLSGGLFNSPAMSALMASAPGELRARASALNSLTRNIGFMTGTSVGSLLLALYIGHFGGDAMLAASRALPLGDAVPLAVFAAAARLTLLVCAGLAAAALVLCLRYPNWPAGTGEHAHS
jgi:EmrB/QacA subfamily drug resistance transporter